MPFYLSAIGNEQQFNANGSPLSGGKINTYAAGTTTRVATYTDKAGATEQANPIILNTLGLPANPIWLKGGVSYKFVITDSTDVVQRTVDDITGTNDPAVASSVDQWVLYTAAPTFISATSFSLAGDQTNTFQVSRRAKTANTGGTGYHTITASAFAAGITTVTVTNDSVVLDTGLSAVSYGLLSVTSPSVPATYAKSGANSDITSLTGLTSALYATGQCRLTLSAGSLKLSPYGGNTITVNGRSCTIPDAGVTLAPTGLLATTLYYIYAVATAGVITSLEASTTEHSVDTTAGNKGVEIKTGDSTRSLVGMAYCKTAATFADSNVQRFVRSWFNDSGVTAANGFTADRTSAVTAGFAVIDAEILTEYTTWLNESISIKASGGIANSGANVNRTGVSIDSTTVAEQGASAVSIPASSAASTAVLRDKTGMSEGYHYSYLLGYVNAGTGTWTGGNPLGWALGVTVGGRR